jgi:exosome complex RNA-binding protein Rrp4
MLVVKQVKMANDTMSTVKGIGSVRLRNEDGSTVLLTKVRYVPRVRALLIGEVLTSWRVRISSRKLLSTFSD